MCRLAVPGLPCFQFLCSVCQKWKDVQQKHGSKCNGCHHEQHPPHPSSAAAATSAPAAPSSPLSMFSRPTGCINQLTEHQRGIIVTLAGEDCGDSAFAASILWDVLLLQHG
jgi:hypothetical protein